MRTLAVGIAVLGLVTLPAHAQMGGGKHHRGDDTTSDQKKSKVDDKAYQDALKRIPEPKEKYDPWGVTRPTDIDKKPPK
jgi:hypothetical protein